MDGAKYLDRFHGTSLRNAFEKMRNLPIEKTRSRITDIDRLLKIRFWDLVEASQRDGQKIPLFALHAEICTYTHLYNNVINNPFKLRWLLSPDSPSAFETAATIDAQAFKQLRRLLTAPLYTKSGRLRVSHAKLLIEAVKMLAKLREETLARYKTR